MLVGDSLLRASATTPTDLATAIVTTLLTIIVGLFAWRPPLAAAGLMVGSIFGALSGIAGEFVLAAAILVGLVAVTCSAMMTAAYSLAVVLWVIAETVRTNGIFASAPSAAIVIGLGAISLVIGLSIRRQQDSWMSLAERLEESEREVAEQLRHERDLIADELHDIVAHEITIVALHAAVLDRTEDPSTRTTSQRAIREAAVQALTDIRRVLGMVRGEEDFSAERLSTPDSLETTVSDVTRELGNAGIAVTARIPEELRLPGASLVALTRVIRESATNVLKHATGASSVFIDVSVERGWVHLRFTDDSPPARDAGLPASGYGIVRLRERFRLFGGTFDAQRIDQGWTVNASLPLAA